MAKVPQGDLLAELEGWSPPLISRTVGKMFAAATKMADKLGMELDRDEVNTSRMKDFTASIRSIAGSIDQYTQIYMLVVSQDTLGKQPATSSSLEELLPLLKSDEMRTLQSWLARLEAFQHR